MKQIIFIVLATISNIANCQTSTYHPFPDSSGVWNIHYFEACSFHGHGNVNYSYTIDGDTTITGITYKKLYTPFRDIITCTNCCFAPFLGYRGAYRNDSINKKVYYIPINFTAEVLLYDFSLNVGDTLNSYLSDSVFYSPLPTIQKIDSVLIGNSFRKRWAIDTINSCHPYIIEGIGNTTGLLEPLTIAPCYNSNYWDFAEHSLTCFSQNGNTLFPSTTTSCLAITGIDTKFDIPNKNILYPNPFHTTANLLIGKNRKYISIEIYNIIGMLLQKENISSQSIIIDRKTLENGIYFYKLINKNGETDNGEFTIN